MNKLDGDSSTDVTENEVAILSSYDGKSTSVRFRSLRDVPKFTVDEAEMLIKFKSNTSTVQKVYTFFTEGFINHAECRAENVGDNGLNKCHIHAKCCCSI